MQKLVNLDTGEILAHQVMEARSFLKRLKGLMFTKTLPQGTCLHIQPCSSIHTFFMNYSIDVIHLNSSQQIIGIENAIKPGKIGKMYRQANSVIELPAGSIQQSSTKIGQTVQIKSEENDNGKQT